MTGEVLDSLVTGFAGLQQRRCRVLISRGAEVAELSDISCVSPSFLRQSRDLDDPPLIPDPTETIFSSDLEHWTSVIGLQTKKK